MESNGEEKRDGSWDSWHWQPAGVDVVTPSTSVFRTRSARPERDWVNKVCRAFMVLVLFG